MLAQQLRVIRRKSFRTQKQLARELGLTEQAVSFWERGYRRPSLASLRELADALPESRAEIEQLAAGAELPGGTNE